MAVIDLDKAVKDILSQYGEVAIEATKEAVAEVAKESAKKLKSSSPRGRTGKYAKGWTSKVETGRVSASATVYGKSGTYQLAHLLEHGHAKRGGGRTTPIQHIEPVEQWAVEEALQRITQKLEGMP
jgi:hypothetical protein